MRAIRLILFICFLPVIILHAQAINPGVDSVFRPDEVAVIGLTMAAEDKAFLLDPANQNSDLYVPAKFHMMNSKMDTVLDIQIGVRLRGNTSRDKVKKSFKLDFREFGGNKFFGYKKFNLKPNVNDPSTLREPLTLLYYRNMDVPAARTHPVKLFMNDEYMGLYSNVEHIDDEFLEARYSHSDGFLYKCSWGSHLTNNGQVFDQGLFESEINQLEDTRAELDHFVKVLNNTSDANFQTEIEKVFNVDRYIRQLAVEALLGHWDGYSFNKNNFYLFYNSQTQLVEFIPYDVDNTWGIDWIGFDWGTRDLTHWYNEDDARPLTKRILKVPTYNTKYVIYLIELLNHYFNEDYLNPILGSYKDMLSTPVSEDTYFISDFGFTYDDFSNSFTEGMDNHVKYGIIQYLNARRTSAIEQIPELVTAVVNDEVKPALYPNPSRQPAVYYSSTWLSSPPVVYTSTGMKVDAKVSTINDQVEISLPEAVPGLYLILINGKMYRWMYR